MAFAAGGLLASEVSLAGGFGFMAPGTYTFTPERLYVLLTILARAPRSTWPGYLPLERTTLHRKERILKNGWASPHWRRLSRLDPRRPVPSSRRSCITT